MQHKLRRFYLVRRVLAGSEFHEIEMNVLGSMIVQGDAVVDIGANVGAYTKQLSSLVGAAGQVLAFEPVASNYDILDTVVRKGGLANVTLRRLAIGSKLEEREIAVPDLGGFTGFYWAHVAKPGEHGEKVSVSTLDELRRRGVIREIDFIKCDVEGFELEVIRGASDVIATLRPAWLIEVSRETSIDVFASFRDAGYRAFVYDGELRGTESYRDREFSNYFFIHPQSKTGARMKIV
jgi:FkbM family methyltransferase